MPGQERGGDQDQDSDDGRAGFLRRQISRALGGRRGGGGVRGAARNILGRLRRRG